MDYITSIIGFVDKNGMMGAVSLCLIAAVYYLYKKNISMEKMLEEAREKVIEIEHQRVQDMKDFERDATDLRNDLSMTFDRREKEAYYALRDAFERGLMFNSQMSSQKFNQQQVQIQQQTEANAQVQVRAKKEQERPNAPAAANATDGSNNADESKDDIRGV